MSHQIATVIFFRALSSCQLIIQSKIKVKLKKLILSEHGEQFKKKIMLLSVSELFVTDIVNNNWVAVQFFF